MIRAVIYARYSSENQQEASIEDQVRNCMDIIEKNGWVHIETFADRAVSGATTLRSGYQALLANAEAEAFDVVVSEGLDRLSRDQEATAALFKRLSFRGIQIFTRSEGEICELNSGLKATMNQLYLKDLGIKTHRGLEGRIEKGLSAGGKAYGYRTRDGTDPSDRGHLEIIDQEASIVVRIFEAFAGGRSPRDIARQLNAEGILGPTGGNWRDSTIRGHATRRTGILRNDLYAGRRVWNKLRYVRDPVTGKRVSRVRPQEEWKIAEVPELQIVSHELWNSVQCRLDGIRDSIRSQNIRKAEFWKARRPKHLLTGLIRCGECGGAMSAVGSNYLGCNAARSGAGCKNRKGVRRDKLEKAILAGLKNKLMAPELVEEFSKAFIAEMNACQHELRSIGDQAKSELELLNRKLAGLYEAIGDGFRSDGLQKHVEDLEARQVELRKAIAAEQPRQPVLHPNLATLYRRKVEDLSASLSSTETRTQAAEILRGLIERIDVRAEERGHTVELTGDIVRLITLPDGASVPDPFKSSVKVVAGAGFEPATFRL